MASVSAADNMAPAIDFLKKNSGEFSARLKSGRAVAWNNTPGGAINQVVAPVTSEILFRVVPAVTQTSNSPESGSLI